MMATETMDNGTDSYSYTYDAVGRRVEKTINGTTTKYLYDGADIIMEMNSSGTPTVFYVRTLNIDEPLARIDLSSGEIRYYHADALGSIIAHPSNHHATTLAKINTWLICQDYYEATGTTLGINDMSLTRGGLFDIYGNWSIPHRLHREGLNVDIDRRVWDPETNSYILIKCKDDDNLEKAVNDNDGSLHCESGGRKHVDF